MRETPGRRYASIRYPFVLASLLFAVAAGAAPARIATFTFDSNPAYSGGRITGTITLTTAAPRNGARVVLATSNAAVVPVPAAVTVPGNATSVTFPVDVGQVAATASANVTATYNNSVTVQVTVKPAVVYHVSVDPWVTEAIVGTSTGTVKIDRGAPPGGQPVTLSSGHPAAVVPATVTIPAGSSQTTFPITTSAVSSQVTVPITAQLEAYSATGYLTINPCNEYVTTIGALPASDVLWVDDALPAGAVLQGATWDNSRYATGAQSLAMPSSNGYQQMQFTGATPFRARASEELFVYVLPARCARPSEIMVGWHTVADNQWKYAYLGQPLIGGEASAYNAGPISNNGWIRVGAPASVLGLADKDIDGISVATSNGQVWVDTIGKHCTPAPAPVSVPPTDTSWVDDNAGSTWNPGYEWDTTQAASGTRSLRLASYTRTMNVAGTAPVFVKPDTYLVVYALLNDCTPPSELQIEWSGDGFRKGAYWGTPSLGGEGTTYHSMGPMPAAGQWVRLEVPARLLGAEGRPLSGMTVRVAGAGDVWIDAAGVSAQGCIPATAAEPVPPSGDFVWFDDVPPPGTAVVAGNGELDASQHASGSLSLATAFRDPGELLVAASLYGANPPLPVAVGENLVAYFMVNECYPPDAVAIRWYDANRQGVSLRGVYYGTPSGWGEGSSALISMGPMPAPGVWHRVEVPARALGFEEHAVEGFNIRIDHGQAWIDRVGKSGGNCVTPRAVQPSMPGNDVIIVDDAMPSGSSSPTTLFDTSQAASGTKSLTVPGAQLGSRSMTISTGDAPLPLFSGEKLVFYVLIDECFPPTEILMRWFAAVGPQAGGAYWGTPHGDGEGSVYTYMGPVPAAGSWARLEVPAWMDGLDSEAIGTMTFKWYDGQLWIDSIGKTGCLMDRAAAPSIPATDTAVIDDSHVGGTPYSYWTTAQSARGAKSLSMQHGPATDAYMELFDLGLTFNAGDKFVFYALNDSCLPAPRLTTQVYTGAHTQLLVWGAASASDPANTIYLPLGPTDVWTRYEVPAASMNMTGESVLRLIYTSTQGHFFIDSIGKGQ